MADYKIKLKNGKTVTLEGDHEPTPEDLEWVGKQYGELAPKQTKLEKIGGVVNSIFPGKQLGDALGNSAYGIKESIKQKSTKPLMEAGRENSQNYTKIAGDVAQIPLSLAPGSMQATKGLKVGQKIVTVAKNAAKGAASGYGVDVTQGLKEGEKGEAFKPGMGTAVGSALPVGINLATGAKNLTGRAVSEASGALTGQGQGGQNMLLQAIERGGNSRKLAVAAMRGGVTGEQVVEEANAALSQIYNKRSQDYTNSLGNLMSSKQTFDISPIQRKLKDELSAFRVKATPEGLDFSQSALRFNKKAQDDIATIYEQMKTFGTKPGDRSVMGLDSLKRAFGDLYSDSGEARKFVASMREEVKKILSKAPGYDEMSTKYGETTDLINNIRRDLSIGDKKSMNAAWSKFRQVLRNNTDARVQLLQELDQASGGKLIPMVSGHMARPLLPRGLTSLFPGGGATTAAMFTTGGALMGILKAIVIGGAAVSPRLAGEVINALGLSRKLTKPVAQALNTALLQFQATKQISNQVEE
jgi:hypothetical protein